MKTDFGMFTCYLIGLMVFIAILCQHKTNCYLIQEVSEGLMAPSHTAVDMTCEGPRPPYEWCFKAFCVSPFSIGNAASFSVSGGLR